MSTEVEQKKKGSWRGNLLQFWNGFISLIWLDGTINFIFRFVAKTSELLLAIGIVVSAADFLTDGRLMHGNMMLSDVWAWTQAIAIESSSGVVLMYALQARKDKDSVKAWIYFALAFLLALVGAVMLLTQIILSTTGINLVVQGALGFLIAVAIARTVVSIAYVVMCRIKHIRFSGSDDTEQQRSTVQAGVHAVDMEALLERLDSLVNQRMDAVIERVTERVSISIEQATNPLLPIVAESSLETTEPLLEPIEISIGSKVQRFIEQQRSVNLEPSLGDIMEATGCSKGTASKYKNQGKEA